jgi:hypothetical protein
MKAAVDLVIGDVIKSPLLDEKKGKPRTVVYVKPRTGLTRVHTVQKHNGNAREIFELRSDSQLIV